MNILKKILVLLFICQFASCSQAQEKVNTMKSDQIVKQLKKGKDLYYKNIRIVGDIDFTKIIVGNEESKGEVRSYIPSSITFQNCIFEGKLIGFEKKEEYSLYVCFMKNLSFISCKFTQDVTFRDAIVEGSINFTDSEFFEKASFEGIFGKGRLNSFNNCSFANEVKFQRTNFLMSASFFKTKFAENVNFQGSYFHRDATFRACEFTKSANFSSMIVLSSLVFNYSQFQGTFTLQNVQVFGNSDFVNCIFNDEMLLKGITFTGETRFNKSECKKTLQIENSYFLSSKPIFDEAIIHDKKIINSSVVEMKSIETTINQ